MMTHRRDAAIVGWQVLWEMERIVRHVGVPYRTLPCGCRATVCRSTGRRTAIFGHPQVCRFRDPGDVRHRRWVPVPCLAPACDGVSPHPGGM